MRRVKEETKDSPGVYNEFIEVLKKYQEKQMSLEEVNASVTKIMADYPILIQSFKAFLPNYYENSSSEDNDELEPTPMKPAKKRPNNIQMPLDKVLVDAIIEPIVKNENLFFKRLKKVMDLNSLPGTDFYLELIKCFELFADSIITKSELAGMVQPLFKLTNFSNFVVSSLHQTRRVPKDENHELSMHIQSQLTELFEVLKSISSSREITRRKYGWFFRPLSDFDTAKTRRHGHSYFETQRPRIFRDKPNPDINGQWVSVPYGSEDVSFRNFRKNAFEDALFKCEDERFDLDMVIENASYTLRLLERALEDANSLSAEQQKTFTLDDRIFSKIRLRPINSIYSEHSSKIIEMLKNSPIRSMPVVISRIKMKIDAWRKTRKYDSERVWKETIEKNYYKSLDHRSFYFKQHEKKMTNPKNFLTEAKLRYSAKEDSKSLLRKYLRKELTQQTFEFLGGSRNTLFFNSISGLSAGVVHKVPEGFSDEVIEEFQELDREPRQNLYAGQPDYSILPHFRLLFSCESILVDSLRIIMYALDKNNSPDRAKVDVWILNIFQDFLGVKIPSDIIKHKIEEYYEGTYTEEIDHLEPQDSIENTKKIIERWIKRENYKDMDIEEISVSEPVQDPMILKKDENFKGYLPILKDNQVMYCTFNLYCFMRFFYDVYERLLKIKIILSQLGKEYEYKKIEFGDYEFNLEAEYEYQGFIKTLCLLLRNNLELGRYEDKCRSMLGNDSYVFFTFDKLINYTAKALVGLTADDSSSKAMAMYTKFSKSRQNEEMYLADFFSLSPLIQVFRFHWNKKYGILSVTYIESPYEKLTEQAIKNSQKYKKHFLSTTIQSHNFEELASYKYRIENYLKSNDLTVNEYCSDVFHYNKISYGMIENSYKFYYIPKGEDYIINSKYYGGSVILENDSDNYLCQDKNSFYQKISELSERKFKGYRDSWIMSIN